MDVDSEGEERLTRWTLRVKNALEEGGALTLFPVEVEVAAPLDGVGLVLGNTPTTRERRK